MNEPWKVFTLAGKEIASYTMRGTFHGEEKATKELLAYENGCQPEDIETRIESRRTGKKAMHSGNPE